MSKMRDVFLLAYASYSTKIYFWEKCPNCRVCPNCHTHFHEYSKKETTNPKDKAEAEKIWEYWLKYVAVIVTMLLIVLGIFHNF